MKEDILEVLDACKRVEFGVIETNCAIDERLNVHGFNESALNILSRRKERPVLCHDEAAREASHDFEKIPCVTPEIIFEGRYDLFSGIRHPRYHTSLQMKANISGRPPFNRFVNIQECAVENPQVQSPCDPQAQERPFEGTTCLRELQPVKKLFGCFNRFRRKSEYYPYQDFVAELDMQARENVRKGPRQ